MVDERGGTTTDLIHTGTALPGEDPGAAQKLPHREQRMRYWGSLCLAIGILEIGLTTLFVGFWPERDSGNVDPVVALALIDAFYAVGTAFLGAGLFEKFSQYGRTQSRRALAGQEQVLEYLETLTGLVAPVPGRIAGMQQQVEKMEKSVARVPDLAQAVIDGMILGGGEPRR